MTSWLVVFVLAAAVVAWAGTRVAHAGDELAERAGLSRLFVGTLLVAMATSLPEVVTDVAAAVGDAPDLAVGDLYGSSMANMAILAVIDLVRRRQVWPAAQIGHARVASIAIALTALATLGTLAPSGLSVAWISVDTLVIGVAYLAAVAWWRRSPVGRSEGTGLLPQPTGWSGPDEPAVRPVVVRFVAAAAMILLAGPVLARAGEELAAATGIGLTFIGSALVATTTSLPELVASIAAVRIGAHDLAVGNLFGSNAFNMFALLVVDVAYTDGPVLAVVDPAQVVAGIGAILLMALAVSAIVHGTGTHVRRLEPDSLLLLAVYAAALALVWRASS
jgi:cation:H+ antiporter